MRSIAIFALATLSLSFLACSSDDGAPPATPGIPVVPEMPPVDPRTGLRVAEHGPVPALPDWPDNPASDAKKNLGKAIYFDGRISGSGTATCGNCHLAITNFQSGSPLDLPDRSYPNIAPTLPRNAPSLLNLVYAPMMRWDGSHFIDLFDMAVFPLAEANMNLSGRLPPSDVEGVDREGAEDALAKKVRVDIPGYVALFQEAFGEDIRGLAPREIWRLAGKAVATYLRVAVSRDAPFDRWNAGDDSAMNESARRGFAIFRGRGKCSSCHAGPHFSDFQFHNVSTSLPNAAGVRPDEGRGHVTHLPEDGGKFLTPMLRSSALTSPYLHDGSEPTFVRVIQLKSGARGLSDPNHDSLLENTPDFTDAEIADMVSFLKALNGKPIDYAELTIPTSFPN